MNIVPKYDLCQFAVLLLVFAEAIQVLASRGWEMFQCFSISENFRLLFHTILHYGCLLCNNLAVAFPL